ncbi:MAG: GAF domain-containing sensor histidine kinase, partial [Anaerolineae bacterium]
DQELVNSLSWIIALRWPAGVGLLAGTWFVVNIVDADIPATWLYLLGLVILAYNALLWVWLRDLDSRADTSRTEYQWFARVQIGLDWFATAVLIHCTGGVESQAILFFFFHIVVASMLLPHDRAFFYVALAPLLVGGVALLEYLGLVPHVNLFGNDRYKNPLYVGSVLAFFTATSYMMAYLSMAVSRRLRRREDQLAALYRSLQTTTSTLELTKVLNRLAEATAQALGCQAAAIRLLDRTGSFLEWAGVYGLSEQYRGAEPIEVAKSPVDQEVLAGKAIVVTDPAQDSRLRAPKEVAAEGIHSIINAPLSGRRGVIGVLRAYGGAGHRFSQDDAEFLAAIAAQGSVAIENAQTYRLLQDLDQSKSEFVRIVSHELRSPVNVAGSLLRLLDRGYVGELSEKQADLVGRAWQRIEFLQTLVDDLLDLAAGRSEVMASAERGPVSLTEIAREIGARFEPAAAEKGLTLHLDCPPRPLTVWGDRDELDRILNNLVSNAVKYTLQGEVRIRLEATDGQARIVVSDTGIGIPEQALPQLYQEFYRAKNAKEVAKSGTGLGLSIVKDLVERYGGEIGVDSVERQGTTVTLLLPLAKTPPG